ncbi:putative molybdenum carrier protein [Aeoliella sp. SH292]|uniref:putative molybdenum carrier protein n=1 Tax=Aeoliella sp. SH292 TaxID=3454464 RepID=UPI003F954FC3
MSGAETPLSTVTIVSGGQTGADRAALDFAIEHAMPHGGWCPRGRRAEDGAIDDRYNLRETSSGSYHIRTRQNIEDSDATVVITIAREVTGGTALTLRLAEELDKPLLHLARNAHTRPGIASAIRKDAEALNQFLTEHGVGTLNIAGPRASTEPKIASYVWSVLAAAMTVE